jgi:hypothetical protein
MNFEEKFGMNENGRFVMPFIISIETEELRDYLSSHYRPIETSLDKEEVRKQILEYFAGSGELWFPYIGVGANSKEEEIEYAKNYLSDLLTLLKIEE